MPYRRKRATRPVAGFARQSRSWAFASPGSTPQSGAERSDRLGPQARVLGKDRGRRDGSAEPWRRMVGTNVTVKRPSIGDRGVWSSGDWNAYGVSKARTVGRASDVAALEHDVGLGGPLPVEGYGRPTVRGQLAISCQRESIPRIRPRVVVEASRPPCKHRSSAHSTLVQGLRSGSRSHRVEEAILEALTLPAGQEEAAYSDSSSSSRKTMPFSVRSMPCPAASASTAADHEDGCPTMIGRSARHRGGGRVP